LARFAPEFEWRHETWETLSHELRHHLEWRANVEALEAYDWAAEQNFARQEGEAFDPTFYRSGEALAPGVYKVDDDVFVEGEAGGGEVVREDAGCGLAVLDVEAPDALMRIRGFVTRGIPVLAYGPHVRAELLRAAREAGAIAVPNSQVEATLRDLLA